MLAILAILAIIKLLFEQHKENVQIKNNAVPPLEDFEQFFTE